MRQGPDWTERTWTWLRDWVWEDHRRDLIYALLVAAWGVVRLAGKTVVSGSTGLKFSFGRATRVCEPGFYPLIPIFQTIEVVPTRSRTLDLPRQRLTTADELVFSVDANLVYRVVDVRKALVEVDEFERAMPELLALGVHEVLGGRRGSELRLSAELDAELARAMARRLEPWGIAVERAGFASFSPDERTLRVTQLTARTRARERALALLAAGGLSRGLALALLGTTARPVSRTRALVRRDAHARSARRRSRWVELLREAAGTSASPAAGAATRRKEAREGRGHGRRRGVASA
jgi:regulator of protease activity HflC (stomatin/prohibitin superfamily)